MGQGWYWPKEYFYHYYFPRYRKGKRDKCIPIRPEFKVKESDKRRIISSIRRKQMAENQIFFSQND